jgi:pyruvate,water dikinase
MDRASGRVLTARVGAKRTWAAFSPSDRRVTLSPLPTGPTGRPCLTADEVRYVCERAVAIESPAGGLPQDVEWAITRDLPFPDSVYFLQHRPETTWTAGSPTPAPAGPTPPAFDPVQYALGNVFKVPGT